MTTALGIDGRTVGQDTAALPALVAVRDPLVRSEVISALAAGGLHPAPFQEGAGSQAADQHAPAVLAVVCEHTIASLAPAQAARLRSAGSDSPLPLLLVTSGTLPSVEDMVRQGITDFVLADRVRQDLGYRAALIRAETMSARHRRASAGMLRERARRISAAIRATNDPEAMAEVVVQGLVQAFDADHAVLLTFPDERVPQLSLAFSRPSAAGTAPGLAGPAVEELARRLWAEGQVTCVEDHLADGSAPLQEAALAAGVRASVFLPLGHGEAAFGMLWLAASAGPRTFTSTERSLMQHVCGNLAHGLVQGHLITAQRKVMVRLRELDQAKTDFVATVNHELRTPLTSITGYLDLILDGSGTDLPDEVQQMLAIVGRNANRLNQLISDLLTLSRSDARESAPEVEEIDLARLLSEVGDALVPTADAGGVSVEVDCAVRPLLVDGDCDQLEQVFTNLLSNAVKFTPAGGTVRVSAETSSSELSGPLARVRVSDTGIGIPAEDLPKLFQRFFRASNATSAAIPGTGLGLAIVQDIVHQHGGELQVTSEVGRGTTFTVQLPTRS